MAMCPKDKSWILIGHKCSVEKARIVSCVPLWIWTTLLIFGATVREIWSTCAAWQKCILLLCQRKVFLSYLWHTLCGTHIVLAAIGGAEIRLDFKYFLYAKINTTLMGCILELCYLYGLVDRYWNYTCYALYSNYHVRDRFLVWRHQFHRMLLLGYASISAGVFYQCKMYHCQPGYGSHGIRRGPNRKEIRNYYQSKSYVGPGFLYECERYRWKPGARGPHTTWTPQIFT